MSGYIRQDTSNNIATGSVINAADLDNEFDAVVGAFNSSSGHKHDGTSGEGAPITATGPTQDVVTSSSALYPKTTNTIDLGTSTLKYKNLYLVGTANFGALMSTTADIASLVATTADINAGTIDATVIGGTTAAAGSFTSVTTPSVTTAGTLALSATGANIVTASTNGTERMRIDASGNVGIGTSSYSDKLTIAAGATDRVGFNVSGVVSTMLLGNQNSGAGSSSVSYDRGTGLLQFSTGTTGSLTAKVNLDASGNVGIGVTPSAWETGTAIQMAAGQGYSKYGVVNNAYYDGAAYRYIATATATLYGNSGGSHLWFNAPSGTAGNAITFTQAMTLDASGNLGIGTTSPTAKLDINAGTNTDIRVNTTASGYLQVGQFANGAFISPSSADATAGVLRLGTSGTERMRIDTSGNVGIGTASPTTKLDVSGTVNATALSVGGTAITATATELNYVSGVTSAIQTQFSNLGSTKANLASPTFTGVPLAPTAAVSTNTTQIATTAFVQAALSGSGLGDMLKAVYDSNNDGAVNLADKWTTARTISIGGTGKSVDGSAAVTWTTAEIGINNSTLTLATSGIATGSQTFTSNQGTDATFTVNVPATDLTATAGTTAGPTLNSSTGAGVVIPSASATASGIVTTAAQTLVGAKTFSTSISTPAATITTLTLGATAVTATGTELNYVSGVTSAIQTQLDGKQASDAALTSISGLTTSANQMIYTTASDTYATTSLTLAGRQLLDDTDAAAQLVTLGLTATAAELNALDGITASVTELNFVDGVTSAIQTQLDGKQPLDEDLTALAAIGTSGILVRTGAGTAVTRAIAAGTGISIADGTGVGANPTISASLASQAQAEAGTDNTTLMTPLRVDQEITAKIGVANSAPVKTAINASGSAPIYACRAWVSHNGSGTILASGNVSSVTGGPDVFTINFTTALPTANFALSGSSNATGYGICQVTARSTTSVTVDWGNRGTAGGGGTWNSIMIFA